ncbi:MAG: hypothetical protein LBG23_04725 [Endomicrobium sp.]|jgi:hypothetical protein|nr:hypothetical protein [Endomicrobium sp.]
MTWNCKTIIVDKVVVRNFADLNDARVKISFVGINKSTVTYNIISSSQNSQGNILVDNTNAQGNVMSRINSYITYDTSNSTFLEICCP